jgi:hypothetical protein
MSSTVFAEVGGSREIVGISSLLFDRGRSLGTDEVGCTLEPLRVFVRDARVADNRDKEVSRSSTKEFVSGSKTSTNSFAFASCMGPLKIWYSPSFPCQPNAFIHQLAVWVGGKSTEVDGNARETSPLPSSVDVKFPISE